MTEDTGGHIAYVLGAAQAQAARPEVTHVDIVTRAFADPLLGAIYDRAEERIGDRLSILRLKTPERDYLSKEALAIALPSLERAFLKLLEAMPEKPDVIHAHFADAARLARAAHRRFGMAWVYTPHSLALEKAGGEANARRVSAERTAIRTAQAIVVSSRDEAERQIMRYCPDAAGRVHRVSPGVDLLPANATRRAERLIRPFLRDPAKPIVLAIARPVRKKNLSALIHAFARNPHLRRRANLVIVPGLRRAISEGPEEQVDVVQELFNLVDQHDLWGHVALPRRHVAEDVRALYELASRSGAFVNPAHHEPFGLTIIEAAQAGVPVVATRNGGPASIIGDLGSGHLVDPSDPANIAEALLQSLDDPDRETRRRRAQVRARELYRWASWAHEVQQIYASLASDRRTARGDFRYIFASDIDDTLTGDRAAARRFRQWERSRADVAFMVATGRSISEARSVIAAWDLPCPETMITSVGSEIWRASGRGSYTLCTDYVHLISEGWQGEAAAEVVTRLGVDSQGPQDQRRWKRSFLGSAEDAARIRLALSQNGLAALVIHSHDRLIDVLPAQAGKSAALRFEAARLGLRMADCIAAGDSGNDLDMLRACGRPILPANARDGIVEAIGGRGFLSARPYAAGVLDGLDHIMALSHA
ncbi:glycosyltransferase [Yangia sp. PrR004]|nr:glycosyltransferase [Salipiger sp. PrR004]